MANYVIGIDLGGTNTVIGLVDVDGKILAKDDSVKTQKYAELVSKIAGGMKNGKKR